MQCGPDYEKVPWDKWENPRLIVMSDGIKVLPQRSSNGFIVPARYVPDVLFANTTADDWLMGRVVIVKISKVLGQPELLERNRSELLSSLSHHGIRAVLDGAMMAD